jgi:hypothetical protein
MWFEAWPHSFEKFTRDTFSGSPRKSDKQLSMREPPLRKTWEYSILSQAMKEVCLEDLIKPNQASHQGARWTSSVSMLKIPVLALIIETSAVWPWCRRSFQCICRGLWIIIAELTCGLFPWSFAWCSPHAVNHALVSGGCRRVITHLKIQTLQSRNAQSHDWHRWSPPPPAEVKPRRILSVIAISRNYQGNAVGRLITLRWLHLVTVVPGWPCLLIYKAVIIG